MKRLLRINSLFVVMFSILFIETTLAQNRTQLINKGIYMHYMPWFDTPEYNSNWGGHWTMSNKNPDIIIDNTNGEREIASHYYPLTGPYDSQDEDVIEYHILLMKYSGIDGILINWYGTIGTNGDVDILLENSNAIVDKSENLNFDFSVVMEDRFVGNENGLNRVDYAHINIEYLKNNYFTKSNFIKYNNQPFFGIFGPIVIDTESEWNYALTAAGEEVIFVPMASKINLVGAGADGGFDWVFSNGLQGVESFYQNTADNLNYSMGCAFPGFEDYYAEGGWGSSLFYLDPDNGNLLNQTLQLAKDNESKIEALQLVTWNDYGEGTIFEPTFEFGFQRLTILQDKLDTPYSEYELQQIFRLYQMRKQYENDQAIQSQLDQASSDFSNHLSADAIDILDDIEKNQNVKYYSIKNRSNGKFLYQDGNVVKYGDYQDNSSFKWRFENAGDGFYFIKNAYSQDRINIESLSGDVECTILSDGAWSGMWEKLTIDGTHIRLLNRWQRNQYLNLENQTGTAEYSTTTRDLLLGQWSLEQVEYTLDVNNEKVNHTFIFPNPSHSFIEIVGVEKHLEYSIFDTSGKNVLKGKLIDKKIDIKSLKNGQYLLKLKNGNTFKFIKN